MNKQNRDKIFYELDKALKHSQKAILILEKFLPHTEKYYIVKHLIRDIENIMDEIVDIEVDKE